MVGLKWQEYPSPFTPHTDIGWRLVPAYWGQGLATEAAQACLHYAWEVLGLEEVRSVAPLANAPSIRVMERLGMRRLGVFEHPALRKHPHLQACACYGILRPSGQSSIP
jgi:RimJ/RimL family protein N-acetyltransferase